jgi:hypothetical protein
MWGKGLALQEGDERLRQPEFVPFKSAEPGHPWKVGFPGSSAWEAFLWRSLTLNLTPLMQAADCGQFNELCYNRRLRIYRGVALPLLRPAHPKPSRLKITGQIVRYLNRTYRVLRTRPFFALVTPHRLGYRAATPVMMDERDGVAEWGGTGG